MKCQCSIDYHVCECGVAHHTGSSNAEHYMNCPLTDWPGGGAFHPNNGPNFPSWECPGDAGMCPTCWHKVNSGRDNTQLQEWVLAAVRGGQASRGVRHDDSQLA